MPDLVMIADDDPRSVKLCFDLLMVFGYRVTPALDGVQAISLAKSRLPDLILMNLKSPLLDSLETVKVLKADALTTRIPVIATVERRLPNKEDALRRAGFDGCLNKPLKVGEVLDVIESYLAVGVQKGFPEQEG
jgi:two-component system cell cycle response regulator DivK